LPLAVIAVTMHLSLASAMSLLRASESAPTIVDASHPSDQSRWRDRCKSTAAPAILWHEEGATRRDDHPIHDALGAMEAFERILREFGLKPL
jgi:hypothetical protein